MKTLVDEHIEYMNRDRNKDDDLGCGDCPCESCGCVGNNECGHECLDQNEHCTLDEWCTCPCCNMVLDIRSKQ